MEFVNGKDDIPFLLWKNINVWNHQPDDMGVSEHVAKTVEHFHFHGNMMINLGKL